MTRQGPRSIDAGPRGPGPDASTHSQTRQEAKVPANIRRRPLKPVEMRPIHEGARQLRGE